MMKWILTGMVVLSVLTAIFSGNMDEVSTQAISAGTSAVEMSLSLLGAMCLWSGLMRVADKAGLTQKLSRLLSPVTCRLFRGLHRDSPAMKAITMNITANMLGLGNAATPLGMEAMRQLEKEQGTSQYASNHMVTFLVLNTASIQLLPTTVATLRAAAGSAAPMDILPCVLISSFVSVSSGLLSAALLRHCFPSNNDRKDASKRVRKKIPAKKEAA